MPLILGVVVFVIEIGNIYVHYSDLQNVADTAALTRTPVNAKKVADANSANFSSKEAFKITTYTGALKESDSADTNFYVKLEKNVPIIFIKVFGDTYKLEAYAVVSEEGKPVRHTADLEKDFNWTRVP